MFRAWLLSPVISSINQLKGSIMATTAETLDQILSLTAQVAKSRAEVIAKIAALEAAITAAGVTDPAIVAALDSLKVEIQASDDVIPDVTS